MTDPTAGLSSNPEPGDWAKDELPLPCQFGNYELLQRLGFGGMAIVYLAQDARDHSLRAVKIPRLRYRHGPARDQFAEEVRALAALAAAPHPNVCGLHEAGEFGNVSFLAMPYIEGETLSAYVADPPRLSPENAGRLVRTLAAAMQHAHTRGVIHRDLKPRNGIVTPDGEPVIVDFGLALSLTDPATRLTDEVGFTPDYFPPEFVRACLRDGPLLAPTPSWDVYSLGVILYELLTGHLPWLRFVRGTNLIDHLRKRLNPFPLDPRARRSDVPENLAAVCERALAADPGARYESAASLAHALSQATPGAPARPARVPRERVAFTFVPTGSNAPAEVPADRVFLDVGNALRPGVIDHHHLLAYAGSTTCLVYTYPELLAPSTGRDTAAVTLVLQRWPDLDAVAAAFLAREYLCEGAFPDRAAELVEYVDAINRGESGVTRNNPHSLYCAYQVLINRPVTTSDEDRWQECLRDGLALVEHVVRASQRTGAPVAAVDAMDVPGVFDAADRGVRARDLARYEHRLADPRYGARRVLLHLPNPFGGTENTTALFVHDVQNADDRDRCLFFKDWARTDAARCPESSGFAALAVVHTEGLLQKRQCIISLRPGGPATLRGLGAVLDQAEGARRREIHAGAGRRPVDDREYDLTTGERRKPRDGYANADPWYDGRSNQFTIVDSPHGGTVLTEEEIEQIFLTFGCAAAPPQPLAGR